MPISDEPPNDSVVALFRSAASVTTPAVRRGLGALQELPGTWVGSGFNLIARPGDLRSEEAPLKLEVNKTDEALAFAAIRAPIGERRRGQAEIEVLGVRYVHEASDAVSRGALRRETGIWLSVPAAVDARTDASMVRWATLSHGGALLAQGSSAAIQGAPEIDSISSLPLEHASQQPITSREYLRAYAMARPPAGIAPGAITDPNTVLSDQVRQGSRQQRILSTTVLSIEASGEMGGTPGGIGDLPLVVTNPEGLRLQATFWIERVSETAIRGGEFLRLQYSQRVLRTVDGIDWPHISVATLVKR